MPLDIVFTVALVIIGHNQLVTAMEVVFIQMSRVASQPLVMDIAYLALLV